MPSYMLRGLPPNVVARAKAKAREAGTTLDDVLIAFLETYAEHGSIASSGGHARALSLTPEQRTTIARKAAQARWKPDDDDHP
jgi:hypothetical protein